MKRSRQIFLSVLTVLVVCLYAAAPRAVYAEETPSGDNTDGGSISLDLVHYQAQSLTLQLNSDHLAYQDVTLDCVDSETGKPVTISLLAAPGSQEYTLYDLDTPVEELTGTLNISMITEPGYELDLDAVVFTINGQTYSSGSSAVITASSASVGSSIVCREAAAAHGHTDHRIHIRDSAELRNRSGRRSICRCSCRIRGRNFPFRRRIRTGFLNGHGSFL